MQYLVAIPGMAQLLRNERAELEVEYSTLRATEMDGMPRGGTPGTPVESLALVMVEKGTAERVNEIDRRLAVLDRDRLSIMGGCEKHLRGHFRRACGFIQNAHQRGDLAHQYRN